MWLKEALQIIPNLTSLKVIEETPVEKHFPLAGIVDQTTYTKTGKPVGVVEVNGRDFSGLPSDELKMMFNGRKGFFDNLSPYINVMHQVHRQKLSRDVQDGIFETDISQKIGKVWNENFKESYRTRHYLVFVPGFESWKEKLFFAGGKEKDDTGAEFQRILKDTIRQAVNSLKSYGAREIEGDELTSYWAFLLNGKHVEQKSPEDGLFKDMLSSVDILFPKKEKYQIYRNSEDRYSGWLRIKTPAQLATDGLFRSLIKNQVEFSLYQTYSPIEKKEYLSIVKDWENNVTMFQKDAKMWALELEDLKQRITNDDMIGMKYRFALEVFGINPEELEVNIALVTDAVNQHGFRVAREQANQEPLFWARFPDNHQFNVRAKEVTSENGAHFTTFESYGQGLESCSWGQSPVSLFKTVDGGDYSFIFHESTRKKALGNTVVIGGSGSGKTTLISFLLSQCQRYKNFKVLAFDRLNGLEIFTRTHGGNYIDLAQGAPKINPFLIPDSAGNRAFLQNWLHILTHTNENDPNHVKQIANAVVENFNLDDISDRNLETLGMEAFGLQEPGSVRDRLTRWLPGGANGDIFSHKEDLLDNDSHITTYDMTTLLDLPDILVPLAYYIFHKLLISQTPGGFITFVDELVKYINNEYFQPHIKTLLGEVRKNDGCFVGATQELAPIMNSDISSVFQSNIATWILYPEPGADKKIYEKIGVNSRELDWIKNGPPHQVLVKRKTKESVVLDVDLTPLGSLLDQNFNSSKEDVLKYRKEHKI